MGELTAHAEYLLCLGADERLVFPDKAIEGLCMSRDGIVIGLVRLQRVRSGREGREDFYALVHCRGCGWARANVSRNRENGGKLGIGQVRGGESAGLRDGLSRLDGALWVLRDS